MKLISTKLIAPAPRNNYIRREELFRKLEHMQEYKVILVQGSAGSGKTTLLASFMHEFGCADFRWVALDEDNNDVFSFWYYVLEALKGDLGRKVDDLLSIFEALPQKRDMENMLILIVNQLHDIRGLTIVLDDFHTVEDPQLLQTIEFFMKYSPDHIRLVILTRETPKLYLGDLMISGKYLEIDESDLRFSADEAVRFLQDTLRTGMDDATAGKLNELAEGWVGGLQLMALAHSHKRDMPFGPAKGLNKYMTNYLSNEILRSLSEEETRFLICTSVLSYFNESLCNQLLDVDDARTLIHGFLEKNMFLVTIDEKAGLYRYHHLFGEFLRQRLAERDGGAKRKLHCKAAAIFERFGDTDESVKHYIQAEQYREALRLICRLQQTVKGWAYLRQIPLEFLVDNRDLLFQRLFYHFCNLEFDQCRAVLDDLSGKSEEDVFWKLLQFTRFFMDDAAVGLEMNPGLIDEIEHMGFSDVTKAIIYVTSSMLLGLMDQYAEAVECIDKAVMLESGFLNPYIRYFALTCKSQLLEAMGDLQECERIYESLSRLVEEHSYLSPLAANSLIGMGGIYMKRMELDRAEAIFEQAERKLQKENVSMERGYVHNRMEIFLLRGDKQEAARRMKQLTSFPVFYEHPLYHSSLLKYQLLIDDADPELLRSFLHWVEKGGNPRPLRYEDRLVHARIMWSQGDRALALAQLDDILKRVRKHKVKTILVESILLKIRILDQDKGDRQREILNLIREAVHYSWENQIAYSYILEGEVARRALMRLKQEKDSDLNENEKKFMNGLLSLWEREKTDELLSARELEVLRVLATGLSNKEIGSRLCISVATVKTHMINIYAKLQVSNRIEAVEKARQIGLLP
ncbi:HTH-type transcriptional regulator MalT [Paenibacillus sp. CECT 9249]|uniref:LuxR C-terminal-related transcriptional regulator n=1 Tax=Paenibacillus sp. CECT 9249 TaxID=2845385 RepID=UPI001E440FD1|nr:LuxR C-terminal-related transcriptional regulator [Paenibacillus sp. CECT 9249]CAH0121254.1 HTH-type transcriptional regulator MalT [Paenibacillus sp. CECT 9249]